jgi:hypothetical protein
MRRNQIAKLSQNSKLAAAWSSRFIFFIPVEWQGKISASSFFLSLYGMAVIRCQFDRLLRLFNRLVFVTQFSVNQG